MDWGLVYITSVFKKRNKEKCKNFRSISVLSFMGRLYATVLKDKIEEQLDGKVDEDQPSSCTDHVCTLQQLTEKKLTKTRAVCAAFIDLKNKYDCP